MAGALTHMLGLNAAAGGGGSAIGGRPYYRSQGTFANTSGAATPGLPTGWKENDIFLLCVQSSNEAISAPAGYTEVSASPQGTGTPVSAGATRLGVFWKRATSSESAPTITDTGDHTIAIIFAFADCIETGDPVDVSAGDVEASGTTAVTFPAVTTSVVQTLLVNVLATARDAAGGVMAGGAHSNANLVNRQTLTDQSTANGTGGSLTVFTGVLPAAGGSGTSTATTSVSLTQNRITLALKPRVTGLPWLAGVGTAAGDSGSATPTVPVGYAANDIFLLLVETANQAVVAPAGYTEIASVSPQGTGSAGAAGGVRLTALWKRATGSESNPTIADTGDHQWAVIIALRGCVTSGDPWEAAAGDVEASASTSVTFPAVTTLGADRLIVNLIAHDTDTSGSNLLSAVTNAGLHFVITATDTANASLTGGGLAVLIGAKDVAGSTGTTTATLGSAVTQGRITLAFPHA